jgi:DNA-binding transcriptional LysR family regulator
LHSCVVLKPGRSRAQGLSHSCSERFIAEAALAATRGPARPPPASPAYMQAPVSCCCAHARCVRDSQPRSQQPTIRRERPQAVLCKLLLVHLAGLQPPLDTRTKPWRCLGPSSSAIVTAAAAGVAAACVSSVPACCSRRRIDTETIPFYNRPAQRAICFYRRGDSSLAERRGAHG